MIDCFAQMEALEGNATLKRYAPKTDMRALAYSMSNYTIRVQSTLYQRGSEAKDLFFIVSGEANVRPLMAGIFPPSPSTEGSVVVIYVGLGLHDRRWCAVVSRAIPASQREI